MNGHLHTVLSKEHTISEEPVPLSRVQSGTLYGAHNQMNHAMTEPFPNGDLSKPRKWTQKDQDVEDSEARRKAMKDLTQTWMDRLQQVSIITTFFAAAEAELLGHIFPDSKTANPSLAATNATLTAALVIHSYAAILAFFAAFFLIRFRMKEVTNAEIDVECAHADANGARHEKPIFSANPHVETTGWFGRGPPTQLLENCHALCMVLAHIGFILALTGVLLLTWVRLPLSVCIFVSVCLGGCLLASALAFISSLEVVN